MPEPMSPELDLLEHCSVEDISFQLALRVFSPDDPFSRRNIERVRRVVAIYVNQGYVAVRRVRDDNQGKLEHWESRAVLEDADTWAETPDQEHRYLLSLTEAGWEAFVEQSRGYFDRLFGREQAGP